MPPSSSPHRALAERIIGSIVQATQVVVSPDGTRLAAVVTRVDVARNRYLSQIWLASADGADEPRALTAGEHDRSPVWSPDSGSLAFVSARSEKKGEATLHVLPVDGPGENRTVATMPDGVGDVAWSPDGRWLAFTSRVRDERYAAEDESWQAPRKIERFFTRLNGEGWVFDRPAHVHVVAADGTGEPRDLTPGEYQHRGCAWLADSSGVVTSAQRHETWDLDFASDLYVVALDGATEGGANVRPLTHRTGQYGSPSVSPDGSQIAFLGQDDPGTFPQNVHVGVIGRDGGEHRWTSRALDRTFETTAGARPPVWVSSDAVVAVADDRGQTHLFRVTVGGGGDDAAAPQPLTSGAITVKSFDAAAGTVAFVAGAVDEVGDVFVQRDGTTRRLTSFADRYRAAATPRSWERFAVPCTDGSGEIDAWIMRPDGAGDADAGDRRYPVIVNVHGGPHTQYGETMFDEAQFQAAAGFVVLMCNPRGSSGREQAWGQSILGPRHPVAPGAGWGSVDVADVLAVVDAALERHPFCDPGRVGMQGGSYGGYMATWLAGTTGTRFAAICSERAVNNMYTEEFTSDISTIFKGEHGPSHIDAPEEYERMSPVRFVRDIQAPFLIVHSEDDLRCPISQAEELFVAMRLLGKDVTFYRFPGEDHELSRTGSPVHRLQRAEIILDFFARHLGAPGQPAATG